uniref:hypothetical protein n=1 Tax=Arthrobacter sp. TaxID=1667 RepID=UPI000EB649E6|nr:hypothetical protein [Arthrobacter sp.]AXV46332.1 hypothetical protein pA40H1_p45 [Arthrobacter sp.]
MSEMKNERVGHPQWKKATLWASAVVLVLILGMALLVIFTPKKDDNAPVAGPSAPTSSPASTPPAQEGCNAPVGDTSSTPKMPDDLRWEAKDGWTWPVSDTYGPTQREGEFGVCFARSPLGAALMAVTLNTAISTSDFKAAVELYVPDSPGRDYALAQSGGGDAEPISYSGFIVDSFTPDNAQVTIVFSTPDTPTGYTGLPLSFRWIDGDWKQVVLDDGSMFRGQPIEPQRGEFVEWKSSP